MDRELNTYYVQKMDGFEDYKTLLKKGVAFYEIIKTVKEESVDLVFMGAHGRTGLDHVLFWKHGREGGEKVALPGTDHPAPWETL